MAGQDYIYGDTLRPHKTQKLKFQIPSSSTSQSEISNAPDTENEFLEIPRRTTLIDNQKFDFPKNQTPLLDHSLPLSSTDIPNLNQPEIQTISLDTTPKLGLINADLSKTTKTQRLSSDTPRRGNASNKGRTAVDMTSKDSKNVNVHNKPLENPPARSSITGAKPNVEKMPLENPPARSSITGAKPNVEKRPLENPPARSSITGAKPNVEKRPLENPPARSSITGAKPNVEKRPLENPPARSSITGDTLKTETTHLDNSPERSSITGEKVNMEATPLDNPPERSSISSERRMSHDNQSVPSRKLKVQRLSVDNTSARGSIPRRRSRSTSITSGKFKINRSSINSGHISMETLERLRLIERKGLSVRKTSAIDPYHNLGLGLSEAQRLSLYGSSSPSNSFVHLPIQCQQKPREIIVSGVRPQTDPPCPPGPSTKPKQRFRATTSLQRHFEPIKTQPLNVTYEDLDYMQRKRDRRRHKGDGILVRQPYPNAKKVKTDYMPTVTFRSSTPEKKPQIKKDKLILPALNVRTSIVNSMKLSAIERSKRNAERIQYVQEVKRLHYARRKNTIPRDSDSLKLCDLLDETTNNEPNVDTRSVRGMPMKNYVGLNKNIWPKYPVSMNLDNLAKKDNYYHSREMRSTSCMDSCEQSSILFTVGGTTSGSLSEREITRSTGSPPTYNKPYKFITRKGDTMIEDSTTYKSENVARVYPKYGRRSKPDFEEDAFRLNTQLKPDKSKSLPYTIHSLRSNETHSSSGARRNVCDLRPQPIPTHGRRAIEMPDKSLHGGQHNVVSTKIIKSRFGMRPPNNATVKLLTKETESLPTVVKMKRTLTKPSTPGSGYASSSRSAGMVSFDEYDDNLTVASVPLRKKTSVDKVVCVRPQIKGIARMNRKQLEVYRQELLYTLPIYTQDDVRKLRGSYDEFICKKLEEDQLPEASVFIRKVVKFDTERRKRIMPGAPLEKPLKHNEAHLNRLNVGLRESAAACEDGRYGFASEIFLRMAVIFMQNDEWWWLSQQLFEVSIMFGRKIRDLLAKHEAMARYIFGMFLFNQLNILDEAEEHLSIAIEYSKGMSWKAKILGDHQDTIFHESSTLLNRITTERSARALRYDKDPSMATTLALKALKISEVSDNASSRLAALFQLARCYRTTKNLNGAIKILKNYIASCNTAREFDNLCIGHRELAECYVEKGDALESFSSLIRYRCVAKSHDKKAHQAEASLYLGRFHWGQRQRGDALNYLREAFMLFSQLEMDEEVEITRSLFGIIRGEHVLSQYARLVRTSQNNVGSLHVHLNWKSRHQPFWSPDTPLSSRLARSDVPLKGALKENPSTPTSGRKYHPTAKSVGIRFAT